MASRCLRPLLSVTEFGWFLVGALTTAGIAIYLVRRSRHRAMQGGRGRPQRQPHGTIATDKTDSVARRRGAVAIDPAPAQTGPEDADNVGGAAAPVATAADATGAANIAVNDSAREAPLSLGDESIDADDSLPPRAFDPIVGQGGVGAEQLATSIAHEIADLASSVEGTAFNLVAAAPERARVPQAAQQFLTAVQRLRTLHAKLSAFGDCAPKVEGASSLGAVLASLNEELQHLCLGLKLEVGYPESLPLIGLPPAMMRNTLLFVCSAMFRAEPGATHLVVTAERSLVESESRVRIELVLDWVDSARTIDRSPVPESGMALALAAARRLVAAHGGDIELEKLPGRAIRALIRAPSARAEPAPNATPTRAQTAQTSDSDLAPQRDNIEISANAHRPESDPTLAASAGGEIESPTQPPSQRGDGAASSSTNGPSGGALASNSGHRHDFGGTIVVEADPGVRAMVARELRATGRPVFVCADGSSVRTFLEATPTRFELLIVDQQHRLDDGDALGDAITRLAPHLKICILGPAVATADQPVAHGRWAQVHRLEKPFGVHELRQALASVLGA